MESDQRYNSPCPTFPNFSLVFPRFSPVFPGFHIFFDGFSIHRCFLAKLTKNIYPVDQPDFPGFSVKPIRLNIRYSLNLIFHSGSSGFPPGFPPVFPDFSRFHLRFFGENQLILARIFGLKISYFQLAFFDWEPDYFGLVSCLVFVPRNPLKISSFS